MSYQASCHCGAVGLTVEGDLPGEAISCNCSHCRRKGFLLTFVPDDKVEVRGEDHLETYQFNKKAIDHLLCRMCGVQTLARGFVHGVGAAAVLHGDGRLRLVGLASER